MTRHDWLLLVLAAAEGDALSPLQLQKSLFLVGHGLAGLVSTDFYDFQPHALARSPRRSITMPRISNSRASLLFVLIHGRNGNSP